MSIASELKISFKEGGYLTRLIYINAAVFLAVKISLIVCTLFNVPTSWIRFIEMPASLSVLIYRPWTIISYMFLHTEFLHIIFNLLALYWFGKIFLMFFNQKQIVGVYILGGLGGAVIYLIGYNLLPYFAQSVPNAYILGASASVMAILFATVVYSPNYEIRLALIGNVRLKYLGLAFLIIDILGITATNAGGSMAHLGGAAIGCLYALILKKHNIDISFQITQIINFFSTFSFTKPKMKVSTNNNYKTDKQWNMERKSKNSRIDEILDKIKKSGYEQLTEDEKKELFDLSNKK